MAVFVSAYSLLTYNLKEAFFASLYGEDISDGEPALMASRKTPTCGSSTSNAASPLRGSHDVNTKSTGTVEEAREAEPIPDHQDSSQRHRRSSSDASTASVASVNLAQQAESTALPSKEMGVPKGRGTRRLSERPEMPLAKRVYIDESDIEQISKFDFEREPKERQSLVKSATDQATRQPLNPISPEQPPFKPISEVSSGKEPCERFSKQRAIEAFEVGKKKPLVRNRTSISPAPPSLKYVSQSRSMEWKRVGDSPPSPPPLMSKIPRKNKAVENSTGQTSHLMTLPSTDPISTHQGDARTNNTRAAACQYSETKEISREQDKIFHGLTFCLVPYLVCCLEVRSYLAVYYPKTGTPESTIRAVNVGDADIVFNFDQKLPTHVIFHPVDRSRALRTFNEWLDDQCEEWPKWDKGIEFFFVTEEWVTKSLDTGGLADCRESLAPGISAITMHDRLTAVEIEELAMAKKTEREKAKRSTTEKLEYNQAAMPPPPTPSKESVRSVATKGSGVHTDEAGTTTVTSGTVRGRTFLTTKEHKLTSLDVHGLGKYTNQVSRVKPTDSQGIQRMLKNESTALEHRAAYRDKRNARITRQKYNSQFTNEGSYDSRKTYETTPEVSSVSPLRAHSRTGQPGSMTDEMFWMLAEPEASYVPNERFLGVKEDQDLPRLNGSLDTRSPSPEAKQKRMAEPADENPRRKRQAGGDLSTFQCMQQNDGKQNDDNPNSRTIEVLQQMLQHYERSKDEWRVIVYRKAIAALRKEHTQKISTAEEARAFYGIGDRLAQKIEEIVQTDNLRRLDAVATEPNEQVLQRFLGIYGVGVQVAQRWIVQGHKTLDDVRAHVSLTPNQHIGLDHYDDFAARIPRAEVERHVALVARVLAEVDPGLRAEVGGSYRRGAPDSGDVDFLVTGAHLSRAALRALVLDDAIPRLTRLSYLQASLAASKGESGSKWHGAAALSADENGGTPGRWRRVDFLLVPEGEWGAALLYFTGNDVFNRSIRLLASKKGMRLNQHGLFKNVIRGPKRQKLNDGELVESQSEERIFELLGVPWWPPEHRIC